MTLSVLPESYPILGRFTIARGSKTSAEIICCQISCQGKTGRGECVPYARYGETVTSVITAIESCRKLFDFTTQTLPQIHENVLAALPAGAARNALDCALWDLEAKLSGIPVAKKLEISPQPLTTACTISLGSPQEMACQAEKYAHFPLLKIKVGTGKAEEDIARMQAVREKAPDSALIVDANEGWQVDDLQKLLAAAANCRAALVEQPLPADADAPLSRIVRPVSVYADESLHESRDLPRLRELYDGVNIKLDKTGGLNEALKLKQQARAMGFGIMVGCMVATSLSMAPAVLLAQGADFVDLDGPLLLSRDRAVSIHYQGAKIFPPIPALWG